MNSDRKIQQDKNLDVEDCGDLTKKKSFNSNITKDDEKAAQLGQKMDNDENSCDRYKEKTVIDNTEGLESTGLTRHDHHEILPEDATTLDVVGTQHLPVSSIFHQKVQIFPEGGAKGADMSQSMIGADISPQEIDNNKKNDEGNNIIIDGDMVVEMSEMNTMENHEKKLQSQSAALQDNSSDDVLNNPKIEGSPLGQLGSQISSDEAGVNQTTELNLDVGTSLAATILDVIQNRDTIQNNIAVNGGTKTYSTLSEDCSDVSKSKNAQDPESIQRRTKCIFSIKSPLSEFRANLLGMLRDIVDLHSVLHKNGTGKTPLTFEYEQ